MADEDKEVEEVEEVDEVDEVDNEEGEEEEEGASKGGGGKKKLVIIILGSVVLLSGLVLGGLYLSGVFDSNLSTEESSEEDSDEEESDEVEGDEEESDGEQSLKETTLEEKGGEEDKKPKNTIIEKGKFFYTFEDINVNLVSSNRRPKFLRINITVALTKEEDILVLETLSPRVTDNIIQFLNALKPKEFAGSANFHKIQDNILLRVRAAAAPIVVTDALINLALVK